MKASNNIRPIDPVSPDIRLIREAVRVLSAGGLVVFPTRCLYGIAADAFHPEAVEKVFRVKGRETGNPLPIMVDGVSMRDTLVDDVPEAARDLEIQVWPGRLTMVFAAGANVPEPLIAGTGKIGIRLPAHPVAQMLVSGLARPITATSANMSGQPGASDIGQLDDALLSEVNLVLDAGPLEGGAGSTVLDVTETPATLLREGAVPRAELVEILGEEGVSGD